jgi:sec-independent protein translocase protein TatA
MVVANVFGSDGIYVLIIAVVVIFGGSQLPKLARNLGMAGKEFRKAHDEAEKDNAQSASTTPPAVAAGPAPQPGPASAAQPPASSAPAGQHDDKITLSKAELDALLHEREARAKREPSS